MTMADKMRTKLPIHLVSIALLGSLCARRGFRLTNDKSNSTFGEVEDALECSDDHVEYGLEGRNDSVDNCGDRALDHLEDGGNHITDSFDEVRHGGW